MSQSASIYKALQEKMNTASTLLEDCHQLMKKLGSDKGSSPALKKKGGLSEEDKVRFRNRREQNLNKHP